MRVAIVGAGGIDTIESNFKETLEHLGHEVEIFDDKEIISCAGTKLQSAATVLFKGNYAFGRWVYGKIAKKVLKFSPALIIGTYRHIIPEFLKVVRSAGKKIPIIHINPDHPGTLDRQYIFMNPYDAYFTKEPSLAQTMRDKFGLNAYYLPESFNPRLHKKPDCTKQQCEEQENIDIVMAANLHPYRVKFLEKLLELLPDGLRIVIYGTTRHLPWVQTSLWRYHGGKRVVNQDKARAFYGAKIVLNNMHPCEFNGVNCRFFEALGCGGFLVSEYKQAIPELAIADKEVITFNTVSEAANKIKYYLDNPQERWTIAEAGYQRAMRDHTYEKRLEFIFSVLEKL